MMEHECVFILWFLELALAPCGLEASHGVSFICAYELLWGKKPYNSGL